MFNVAVLGYGVVGSGVVEIIQKNGQSIRNRAGRSVGVKRILDIRDFPQDPNWNLFTKNADDILNDSSIGIVVETIGGTGIAYELTKRALSAGKSVVTSNKELIAAHGPELLSLAREKNAYYLFEASVGGGIPIIRPMYSCLAANEIKSVTGILNGTTNYILTAMKKGDKSFSEALAEAQKMGYAEANPAADIEGHDACRKIAILSSIAFNQFVDYRDIETEGISRIAPDDFYYARILNGTIKLIGESRRIDDVIYARVSPVILDNAHPLANVEDVFNAIMVEGDAVGDAMFYGRGAGKLPTASAVVADIIDIMKKCSCSPKQMVWSQDRKAKILNNNQMVSKLYVRIDGIKDKAALKDFIAMEFGEANCHENPEKPEQLVFIPAMNTEYSLKQSFVRLETAGYTISNVLRMHQ